MLLFARGGMGKTTAAVELALHLASGVDWLGFEVARPLRVLFIENEGPREPFRAKLELKRELWEHKLEGAGLARRGGQLARRLPGAFGRRGGFRAECTAICTAPGANARLERFGAKVRLVG
jgi:hypothetical protein